MLVDFHMHSTFSDGVESPESLFRHSLASNLSMISLTDHDEIDGIMMLRDAQKKWDFAQSIKIITGCEFSSNYKGKDIHILGYCFDETDEKLMQFINYVKAERASRVAKMIQCCNEAGYRITMDMLENTFPHARAYGRPHIGQLLIDNGYAKDINEVFSTVLHKDSPCYIPKVKIEVPKIIDIIHTAGGLAVMAHPKLIRNDDYVVEMLEFDFDGIEVYHSKHDSTDESKYKALAMERHLFITGGSDYHGIQGKPPARLGDFVVDSESVSKFIDLL